MNILLNFLTIFISMLLGLWYSYHFWWFPFIGLICIFAWLSLIMPSFFKFKISDFKTIFTYKKIIFLNILINFLILPLITLSFWYFISDKWIVAGLFLLSLLPWWWMIMQWIEKSWGNTKLWLQIFIINLLMLVPAMMIFYNLDAIFLFLWFSNFIENSLELQSSTGLVFDPKAFVPFVILVLIPFLVSRFILKFFKKFPVFVEKNKEKIWMFSISIIVFYLLGLSSSKAIFETTLETLLLSFFSCLLFYVISLSFSFLILRKNKDSLALFWNISTKYITFWMALSTLLVSSYWVSFVLIFIFAYFIQILLSFVLSHILKNKS